MDISFENNDLQTIQEKIADYWIQKFTLFLDHTAENLQNSTKSAPEPLKEILQANSDLLDSVIANFNDCLEFREKIKFYKVILYSNHEGGFDIDEDYSYSENNINSVEVDDKKQIIIIES